MIEWYTKNTETFYAGDRDCLEQIMHTNAKALLDL